MNFNGEIDWSSDVAEDGDTVAEKLILNKEKTNEIN